MSTSPAGAEGGGGREMGCAIAPEVTPQSIGPERINSVMCLIEFLTKPFHDQDLLDAVQLALAQDRAWRAPDG
jgi:hypothetical protein